MKVKVKIIRDDGKTFESKFSAEALPRRGEEIYHMNGYYTVNQVVWVNESGYLIPHITLGEDMSL